MTHPLDGARAKVRRAGKHLRELDAEVERFVKDHPYRFVPEPDEKTGLWVVRIYADAVDEQPPLRLGVIVGDIAHDLRSALDHVVCELALLNNSTCEETQFPLCFSPKAFGFEEKKRLAGLLPRHRAMIRRLQPYHRRQGGELLAVLRSLSNADKHRVVNPATQAMRYVPPTFEPRSAMLAAEVKYREAVRMEDGAEYLRFTKFVTRPGTEVQVKLDPTYQIIFGEPGKYSISPYSLRQLRDHIRNTVWRFAKEF